MTAEEREHLAASRREYVDAHFHEKSYAEMAAALGISKSSVAAMASRMGLKNGESPSRLLSGRRRKELVRRERARTAFGLEQKSRLKVTANRAKEEDIDISEDAAAFAPSVATYDVPSLGTRTDDGHPAGERAEDEEEPEGPAPRAEAGEGKAFGEGAADKGAPARRSPERKGKGGAAGEVPPSRPGARTTVFPHPPLTVGNLRKKLRDDPGFSETIRMVRKAA